MENIISTEKPTPFIKTSIERFKKKAPLIAKAFEDKGFAYGTDFGYGVSKEEPFVWFNLPDGASFFATFETIPE